MDFKNSYWRIRVCRNPASLVSDLQLHCPIGVEQVSPMRCAAYFELRTKRPQSALKSDRHLHVRTWRGLLKSYSGRWIQPDRCSKLLPTKLSTLIESSTELVLVDFNWKYRWKNWCSLFNILRTRYAYRQKAYTQTAQRTYTDCTLC